MKKILPAILSLMTLFSTKMVAQEPEVNTIDTLTSTVAGIQSTLDVMKRVKISGYIQAQFNYAEGTFAPGMDKRFLLRRGRIKTAYTSAVNEKGWSTSQYVLQFDVSEKGLNIKDAYALLTDPWSGWVNIQAGMFNRPFGYEIVYSSSMRESPERGRMSPILFPNERDLGASIAFQGPKVSNYHWLRIEGGWFNGTGAPSSLKEASEFDKKKDFIGRLSFNRSSASEKVKFSGGVSMYDGGYRIDSVNVYEMATDSAGTSGFKTISKATDNYKDGQVGTRGYTKRQYYGVDAQVSVDWKPGITTVRAEYIQGKQPGTSGSNTSPSAAVSSDIYYRNFNGAYIYLVQNIMRSPWQVVLKYDWFDPNTDVKGNEVGKAVQTGFKSTGATDLRYDTFGFGLAYRWDANVKLSAYYDNVMNETTTAMGSTSPYAKDLKDNVVTVRVQVKF